MIRLFNDAWMIARFLAEGPPPAKSESKEMKIETAEGKVLEFPGAKVFKDPEHKVADINGVTLSYFKSKRDLVSFAAGLSDFDVDSLGCVSRDFYLGHVEKKAVGLWGTKTDAMNHLEMFGCCEYCRRPGIRRVARAKRKLPERKLCDSCFHQFESERNRYQKARTAAEETERRYANAVNQLAKLRAIRRLRDADSVVEVIQANQELENLHIDPRFVMDTLTGEAFEFLMRHLRDRMIDRMAYRGRLG